VGGNQSQDAGRTEEKAEGRKDEKREQQRTLIFFALVKIL